MTLNDIMSIIAFIFVIALFAFLVWCWMWPHEY